MNAYAEISRSLAAHPDKILLQDGRQQLSAAEIDLASARYSSLLSGQGLSCGERVMTQVQDSVQALLLYLGALRAGCILVPLPMAWRDEDLPFFVADARPRLIICSTTRRQAHERLAQQRSPEAKVMTLEELDPVLPASGNTACAAIPEGQPALILYTSGTSGQPHGALVGHARLVSNAQAISERWALSEEDSLLATLPLFSMQGLCIAVHAGLAQGARLILPAAGYASQREVPVSRELHGATVLLGTPADYAGLLSDPGFSKTDAKSIRLFASACAPLRKGVAQAFEQRSGLAPRQCYGSPETGIVTADFPDARFRIGTVGKVLRDRRLRIVGSNLKPMPLEHLGEIQLPEFEGWWQHPANDACTPDGWFRTGDIGMYDEDDFISVSGRTDDRFISGYYTIDPEVIECVLETLPGVAEAVVIDVPDPALQALVTALVVPAPGARLTEAGVLEGLRKSLPQHLIPTQVRFTPPFPRNPLGRIRRRRLRKQLREASA